MGNITLVEGFKECLKSAEHNLSLYKANLRGAAAIYHLVTQLCEQRLPDIDTDFAIDLLSEFDDLLEDAPETIKAKITETITETEKRG